MVIVLRDVVYSNALLGIVRREVGMTTLMSDVQYENAAI